MVIQVMDHLTSTQVPQASRQVLEEAARIARGKIKPLDELKEDDYDAVIIPGG